MGLTSKSQAKALSKLDSLKQKWSSEVEKRPQLAVSSKKDYDKLIAAVEESTRQNEAIGELKDRVRALGKGASKLAETLGLFA